MYLFQSCTWKSRINQKQLCKCHQSLYNCKSNYYKNGYVKVFKLPKASEKRNLWISKLPNSSNTLLNNVLICITGHPTLQCNALIEEEKCKIDACIKVLCDQYAATEEKLKDLEKTAFRLLNEVEDKTKEISGIQETISSVRIFCGTNLLPEFCESIDGELLWIVENFRTTYEQAAISEENGLLSPVFKVGGALGYKMRLRLFLHGVDNGKNTHLSLYIHILKSEQDCFLKWPFNGVIKFNLHSAFTGKNHVFQFKSNSCASFQRPKSYVNPDNGISKFYLKSKLLDPSNGHIIENKLFIKATVLENQLSKAY